jgi:hypothetical protein
MLTVLGLGVTTSLAGCSFSVSTQDGKSINVSVPESENTNEQPDSSQDRTQEMKQAHSEVLEEAPSMQRKPEFQYDRVNIVATGNDDETPENPLISGLTAAPSENSNGDRLMITIGSQSRSMLRELLLVTWGAPTDEEVIESTAFDEEVSFVGGEGIEIAAAAAIGTHPDRGDSIYLTRGKDLDQARKLAESFETISGGSSSS